MTDDQISKAFKNVAPGDITELGEHFFEHNPGPEEFEQFIDRHLYSVRYGFVAADGVINPVCALSDGRTERLFAAEDDETLRGLLERMATMAQATGSTRFFFSRLIPTTMTAPEAPQPTDSDPRWRASLLWFAEDRATATRNQGSMAVVDRVVLGENEPAPAMGGQIGEWLHAVLG